mmetsp:Transcript_6817/g.29954  ORF Transcript_6817/g.29954 Transcript_6817/m.29954 type:complete len:221 (-) Transcript_6817:952-1614(-)
MPLKCPPSCRMLTTCFHCSTSSSHSSLLPKEDLGGASGGESLPSPSERAFSLPCAWMLSGKKVLPSFRQAEYSTREMLRSSCSLAGVFSLACFLGLSPVHFFSSCSNGSCFTRIFIFCLGVRSPCLITASTARSSSFGGSGCPFFPFFFCSAGDSSGCCCIVSALGSYSVVVWSAASVASIVALCSGATACRMIARRHTLASSKYLVEFLTNDHPLTSHT